MKKGIYLCLIFIFILASHAYAQLTILCMTEACGNVTPGATYVYQASNPSFTSCTGIASCRFKWEVTNGVILNNNSSSFEMDGLFSVNVRWNNTSGNGTLKVTTSNSAACTSCPGAFKDISFPIRYLGVPGNIKINGTAYTGTYNLPCNSTPLTLSVDAATNATNYTWTLPGGWTYTGSGSTITATPTAGAGGTITVTATRSDAPGLSTAKQLIIVRPQVGQGISGIIGNDYICSGTQTYSLSGVPASGTTINWSKSGNGINLPGSTTGSSVNVGFFTNEQNNTLTATITDACGTGGAGVRTKTVRAGIFTTTGFTVDGPSDICPYSGSNYETYYSIAGSVPSALVSNISWNYSSQWPFGYSPSGNDFKLVTPSSGFGMAWVEVGILNECGYSAVNRKNVYELPSGSCTSFIAVSPNPATEILTLEFGALTSVEDLPESMTLFSENAAVAKQTIHRADLIFRDHSKVDIDVRTLARGVYFLHLQDSRWKSKEAKKIRIVLK